jgi:hypothetical protein
MDKLIEYAPFLIPVLIIELILAATALIHVLKHPHYRFGNKIMWSIIVVIIGIVGPVVYFTFGKGED